MARTRRRRAVRRRYHLRMLQIERAGAKRARPSVSTTNSDDGDWGSWRQRPRVTCSGPLADLQAMLESGRRKMQENTESLQCAKAALTGLNQQLHQFGKRTLQRRQAETRIDAAQVRSSARV